VEEAFKKLATAYQVLSDPELRHKYNEFGASTPGLVPEDGFVDPEEVFGSLFGGGRFKDIVSGCVGQNVVSARDAKTYG
jgi:DnaJ-class molecular chaperone